jgi:hypothetical protein
MTQLAGKKRLTERRKKTLAKLASKLKKITRQFQIPIAFGEFASGYFHPCVRVLWCNRRLTVLLCLQFSVVFFKMTGLSVMCLCLMLQVMRMRERCMTRTDSPVCSFRTWEASSASELPPTRLVTGSESSSSCTCSSSSSTSTSFCFSSSSSSSSSSSFSSYLIFVILCLASELLPTRLVTG